MSEPIVVTGITGHVGGQVADELLDRGEIVRGVTHSSQPSGSRENLEMMQADLSDPGQAREALEGSSLAYLTPPEQGHDPLELELDVVEAVLEAAQATELEHLITHTILHTDREGTGVPMIDQKAVIEERIRDSGVPYSILRPGFFLQTLLAQTPHERRSKLHLPFPPAHEVGAIGVPDIASAALGLMDNGPQHRGFDLHLPDGVSGQHLAQTLTRMLDRTIEYVEDYDGLSEFLGALDMGPQEKQLYTDLFAYARAQDFVGDPHEIEETLPEFAYSSLRSSLHETVYERRRPFGPPTAGE